MLKYVSFPTFMCNKNIICRVCIEKYLPLSLSTFIKESVACLHEKTQKSDGRYGGFMRFPKMGGTRNHLNFDHLFIRSLGIDT